MPEPSNPLRLAAWLCVALACVPRASSGAVEGKVINGTTGQPAGGVLLTLSSFLGGMTPLEETVSAADGGFAFTKALPSVAEGQPFAGAVRAELDGVFYTEILRRDSALDDVRIQVYSARASDIPPPSIRVVVLEPEGSTMTVRETFVIANSSVPPVTYSSERGTLKFYLPDEANGQVSASATGPAGMPLPSTAQPTGNDSIYMIDFGLKPGESRISLQYAVPYEGEAAFRIRSVYDGLETRLGVPEGVTVEGAGIVPLGTEPTIRASLFGIPGNEPVDLVVKGRGTLAQRPSPAADISVEAAPVAKELAWIVVISTLILGLGFLHLLNSKAPPRRGSLHAGRG